MRSQKGRVEILVKQDFEAVERNLTPPLLEQAVPSPNMPFRVRVLVNQCCIGWVLATQGPIKTFHELEVLIQREHRQVPTGSFQGKTRRATKGKSQGSLQLEQTRGDQDRPSR